MRRALEWLVFLATRGVSVILALDSLSRHAGIIAHSPWGDYADAIRHGLLPYRDFDVLYPPGLVYLSWLGSALPASAFHSVFIVFVFASEAGAFALLREKERLAYLLVTFLGPLQLLQLYAYGAFYDSLPAFLVLGCVYLLREPGKRREALALVLLGFGVLLKTYPIVIVPFVLIYIVQRGGSLVRSAGILGASVAIPVVPFLAIDARGVVESVRYFGRRAIEWESTAGLLVHLTGPTTVELWPDASAFTRGLPTYGWGFWAIHGPHEHAIVRGLSLLFVAGVVAMIVLAARTRMSWAALNRWALAGVLLLLLTTTVFSPLYIAWLVPMLALQQDRRVLVLGSIVGLLTTVLTWWTLGMTPSGFGVVGLRAAILAVLVGLLVTNRCASSAPAGPAASA